ncbi:MAG: DUF333 domain-containing protein, partial [Candidatus Lokiarchaeota archaeon]|nr:DUF333 domain-containing protein [Candidatus Lokiarchaeota archaeon]
MEKKIFMRFLFFLVGIIFFISPVMSMLNPSEVYCEELGYKYIINKTDDGDVGICVIKEDVIDCQNDEDGEENCTIIEEGIKFSAWDFFKGKTGEEYSYCSKQGYSIEILNDGNNSFSEEYAACNIDLPKALSSNQEKRDLKSGTEIGSASIT